MRVTKKQKDTPDEVRFNAKKKAANRQIAASEAKNMIELLRLAQDSNIYSAAEMKTKFQAAEKLIFKPAAESSEDDEEVEVLEVNEEGEENNDEENDEENENESEEENEDEDDEEEEQEEEQEEQEEEQEDIFEIQFRGSIYWLAKPRGLPWAPN